MDQPHPRAEPTFARNPTANATAPSAAPAHAPAAAVETPAAGAGEDAAGQRPVAVSANDGYSGPVITSMSWRRPPLAGPLAAAQPRNPSLPTFVGLIMLILTFFIVLTSISINDRKKADAAMASLQDAFSGDAAPMLAHEPDADAIAHDFIQGLTGRIQSLVPLMGGEKASSAENQVLWLPLSLAFTGEATALTPEFLPVLQELLTAGGKIPAQFDYKIEIRLCEAAASDRLRQRASALVAALTTLQAPMQRFVIGTQGCDPERIGFAVALTPVLAEANP